MNRRVAINTLAAANPVSDTPSVPTAEQMLERIAAAPELAQGARVPTPAHKRLRRLSTVALGAAMAAGAVILALASAGTDAGVAAMAYAATSTRPGLVEATFQTRSYENGRAETLRQQQWVDTDTGQTRETLTVSAGNATQTMDLLTRPGWRESWNSSPNPNVIRAERTTPSVVAHAGMAFGGVRLYELGKATVFRDLYRAGAMRLRGHETLDGQSLWKLESQTAVVAGRARSRLVALVDPHTFLLRRQTLLDVGSLGHPRILARTDLLTYRNLPKSSGVGQFDLRTDHPHAKVLIRDSGAPIFRPVHRHNS